MFKDMLVADGPIGKDGFEDYTTKSGKLAAKVSVCIHPNGKDGPPVWYKVFCSQQTKAFMVDTCGYGPGDTVIISGEPNSYKEFTDGEYKVTAQECKMWGDVSPAHKKFQKPSEITGQQVQQQVPQAPPAPPQQPEPAQVNMTYEQAKAAAQAPVQQPAAAPQQVPQAPQAPVPAQMPPAEDDETLPI